MDPDFKPMEKSVDILAREIYKNITQFLKKGLISSVYQALNNIPQNMLGTLWIYDIKTNLKDRKKREFLDYYFVSVAYKMFVPIFFPGLV